MDDKKILVKIKSDGELEAETFGFNGVGCIQELDKLLKDLSTSKKVTRKPEYFKNKNQESNVIKVKH